MKKIIVGKIYANWCGHCQHLKPEWSKMKKLIKMLEKKGFIIQYVEIEESETNKMDHFKTKFPDLSVNGYPTIFKNTNGNKLEYYGGDRSASKMKEWVLGKPSNNTKRENSFHLFSGGKGNRKTLKRRKNNNKTLRKNK